jgi:hypothetical protein
MYLSGRVGEGQDDVASNFVDHVGGEKYKPVVGRPDSTRKPKRTPEETAAFIAHCQHVENLLLRAHDDVASRRLSLLSFHVLWFLTNVGFLKQPNRQSFMGPTSLAKEMGSKRSPIQRALKELEMTGYLVLVSKGRVGLKNCPSSFRLGTGEFVGLLGPTTQVHKVPGDPHSESCRSQETHNEPLVGPRRAQSILEASDSISEADSISDIQEDTGAAHPVDVNDQVGINVVEDQTDQPDASACSDASASSPGPAGTLVCRIDGLTRTETRTRPDQPSSADRASMSAGIKPVEPDRRNEWFANLRRVA